MMKQVCVKVKNALNFPIGHEDGIDIDELIQIVGDLNHLTQDLENNQTLVNDPNIQQMLVNILTKNYDIHFANLRKLG